MNRASIVFGFLTLIGCGFSIRPSDAAPAVTRTEQEARGLFRFIQKAETISTRCRYDKGWASYPIPYSLAHAYLGSRLHADLSAPDEPLDFRSAIDPLNRNQDAFCSADELAAYTKDEIKNFETSTAQSMKIARSQYTFPVFDNEFNTAIVVVIKLETDWRFRTKNGITKGTPDLAIIGIVYRKINGHWRTRTAETLAVT